MSTYGGHTFHGMNISGSSGVHFGDVNNIRNISDGPIQASTTTYDDSDRRRARDRPQTNREDYTVGWICALPTEMAAAMCMLDERHNGFLQPPDDHNSYVLGRIGSHRVAIACLPVGVMGHVAASRVASRMKSTFTSLRIGLMVGIGGGVPSNENDIRLGDVVVSKPDETSGGVIQYDFGKTVQEGHFTRVGSLNRPPDILLNAVARLQAKHMCDGNSIPEILAASAVQYPLRSTYFSYPGVSTDLLFQSSYEHKGPLADRMTCEQCHCDPTELKPRVPRTDPKTPAIHYGLIASGNQVIRHAATRDRLRKEMKVLCFEMEAAGIIDDFPCLVVRGISDYADSHKTKIWQDYAAATAAAYTKELLTTIPGDSMIETTRNSSVSSRPPATRSRRRDENYDVQPHRNTNGQTFPLRSRTMSPQQSMDTDRMDNWNNTDVVLPSRISSPSSYFNTDRSFSNTSPVSPLSASGEAAPTHSARFSSAATEKLILDPFGTRHKGPEFVRALIDFSFDVPGFLNFRSGDLIYAHSLGHDRGEGRLLRDGSIGYFPSSLVRVEPGYHARSFDT